MKYTYVIYFIRFLKDWMTVSGVMVNDLWQHVCATFYTVQKEAGQTTYTPLLFGLVPVATALFAAVTRLMANLRVEHRRKGHSEAAVVGWGSLCSLGADVGTPPSGCCLPVLPVRAFWKEKEEMLEEVSVLGASLHVSAGHQDGATKIRRSVFCLPTRLFPVRPVRLQGRRGRGVQRSDTVNGAAAARSVRALASLVNPVAAGGGLPYSNLAKNNGSRVCEINPKERLFFNVPPDAQRSSKGRRGGQRQKAAKATRHMDSLPSNRKSGRCEQYTHIYLFHRIMVFTISSFFFFCFWFDLVDLVGCLILLSHAEDGERQSFSPIPHT
eukprot:gene11919-8200_t